MQRNVMTNELQSKDLRDMKFEYGDVSDETLVMLYNSL